MDAQKTQFLLSILMESPLYMTLSVKERHSLLARLESSYPSLFLARGIDRADEDTVGYESSWAGIF